MAGPVLSYLIVTAAGLSTSSLGIAAMRADPNHPMGLMLGVARSIRTDEWLTEAPIEIGVMVHGSPVVSPLTHAPDLIYQVSSGGLAETVLFFEGNLLRLGPWLPDSVAFAAFRAFPFLLVLLTLPPLLRRFGATRPLSWLGALLTLLAPASVWWSFYPVKQLAFAAAGSYLLVLARDRFSRRSWLIGTLWSIGAGVLIARLGTFYVPWSLTLGIPIVAATTAYLVADRQTIHSSLRALVTAASTSLLLLGGTLWENRAALRAELATVYPGLRRSSGSALSPYQLFGAPGLSGMQSGFDPVISNKSEISSAFLVAGLWALVLWAGRRTDLGVPDRWAARVLAAFTALWASWILVDWGSLGERIPGLNLVTPPRAAQTVGFIAALLACVVVSQATVQSRSRLWPVAGAVTGLVTVFGVHDLGRAFPNLSPISVWLSGMVTGALVAAVTRWPRHWAPVAAVCAALVLMGCLVNPVLFGLGDLRASATAQQVRKLGDQLRDDGGLAAADATTTTALLVANGVPSLTGYQVTGPDRSAWHKIDPSDRYEERWNRAASYLRMTFDRRTGLPPIITNPMIDSISISADPCALRKAFNLRVVISVNKLTQPCLTEVSTFRWSGVINRVYRIGEQSTVPMPTG